METQSSKATFAEFLKWEAETRDVLDFKKIYVDIAGDLHAGLVLSELMYWYLPAKDGSSRLRVRKQGRMWIAVRRWEWWDRCRMTPRQADRGLGKLLEAGLIEKALFKFYGEPTTHVALKEEAFLAAWAGCLEQPPINPFLTAARTYLLQNPDGLPEGPNSPKRGYESPHGEGRELKRDYELPGGDGQELERDRESPEREDEVTGEASPLTEITTTASAEDYTPSPADAEVRERPPAADKRQMYEKNMRFIAMEFSKYAGLRPMPAKGEANYADWRKAYTVLLGICDEYHIHPTDLAILCTVKRQELGFLAGRPGAYLKTAQNIGVTLSIDSERDYLYQRAREFYKEYEFKHPNAGT